jgi:hypothetical protein
MSRTLFASALVVACALPAGAQSTYSTSRDTLRFRETTQLRMTMTTPQGDIPMSAEHRALVALVHSPGDSARAWFDSLSVMATGPQGEQRPATDSALKRPIQFRLDARGRVSNVVAPKWPASLQGMSDPAHHFDDYFLRLPTQPLRIGLTWSDTTTYSDSTAERFTRWVRRTDYRVERDTTVGTTPALVVRTKQSVSATIGAPVPNQGMRSDAQLIGDSEGFFVFSPKTGRLIGRRAEGKLEGPVKITGAMGEMQMSQSINVTSSMDAVQ